MSKIRILPEHLANQIAAGEVVERPASVVKELLENSLDAGASHIDIEIEGGGTRLIRVIDNGEGMDEDDILLCLERHGTSKIKGGHELDAISTLGFRGEAIPSIGSVSKMRIISRSEHSPLGTKVVYEYGKLLKVHETGTGRGTQFEIRNLFGNTPARRKFLRTVRTELGHIEEIIKNYGLASPSVTFSLHVNNRETLRLNGNQSLKQRLAQVMRFNGDLITIGKPLSQKLKHGLHGLIAPPETTASIQAKLRLFVNGRAVKDRMMAHAMHEGLRGFLMKGRSASGYLHLRIPVEEIDVNVHPAKHEIRFRNARDVHEQINQAVTSAIHEYQGRLQSSIFRLPEKKSAMNTSREVKEDHFPKSSHSPSLTSFFPPPPEEHNNFGANPPHQTSILQDRSTVSHTFQHSDKLQTNEPEASQGHEQSWNDIPSATQAITQHEHGLKVIGQFQDLYILCQSDNGLVVIDQHAAHERLLFEKFRQQFTEGRVTSQTLMFPETIELSLFQIQIIEKNSDEIRRMGFIIKEFGGNSYLLSAIPALAGTASPNELILDLLETFGSEKDTGSGSSRLDNILATMACKAAVKSGDNLSIREMDALLAKMARANLFSHCPHGRPVVKQFNKDEIKKWFYRT